MLAARNDKEMIGSFQHAGIVNQGLTLLRQLLPLTKVKLIEYWLRDKQKKKNEIAQPQLLFIRNT